MLAIAAITKGVGKSLPVEAGYSSESINILKQLFNDLFLLSSVNAFATVLRKALHVFCQILSPHRTRGKHVVVAVIATPFGEMVGNIKRSGGRSCIFVIDEMDVLRV